MDMSLGRDWPEIRDAITQICADFPGSYWREKDAAQAYPT
jgi:acyl-CoA dehydrogenase